MRSKMGRVDGCGERQRGHGTVKEGGIDEGIETERGRERQREEGKDRAKERE